MTTQLHIRHRTAYRYEDTVKYSAQMLRLTPRREGRQRTVSWSIQTPGRRSEQVDAHGNITHLLTVESPHREIEIVVGGSVEVNAERELIAHEDPLSPLAYLATTPLTAADEVLTSLGQDYLRAPGAIRDRLYALAQGVRERVKYTPGATSVEDVAAAAFARGEGVCQDHAHIFIACCRAARIPARYVSGYLYSGDGGDAASHAWADAWIADRNAWLSIDVTHREPSGINHCRLAVGRDYRDAAPVRGIRHGGGREAMDVSVSVAKAGAQ